MHATQLKPMMSGVRPSELKWRVDQGVPIEIIDVRTPAEYRQSHLPGSVLVPLGALDPRSILAMRRDPLGAPIYLLCRTGKRAALAAEKFARAGFQDAIVIEGGLTACRAAGWPLEREPGVISLERQIRVVAGLLIVLGLLLGWIYHPAFYFVSLLVAGGLVFSGVTDTCMLGTLLEKFPWNKRAAQER